VTLPPEPPPEDHEGLAAEEAAAVFAERWGFGLTAPADCDWGPDKREAPQRYLCRGPSRGSRKGPGLIPMGAAGFLFGEGGVGKGWAALDLAVAVAAGDDGHNRTGDPKWFGAADNSNALPIEHPGLVLFLSAEDRRVDLVRRLHRLRRARFPHTHRIPVGGTTPPIHADALANHRPEWRAMRRAMERLTLVTTQDRESLRGIRLQDRDGDPSKETEELRDYLRRVSDARELPWRLIVVDTLSRLAAPEAETDNAVGAQFIEALEELTHTNPRSELPPVVLALHHTSKGATREKGSEGLRGSSSLGFNARWAGGMFRAKSGEGEGRSPYRWLDVGKVNHAPEAGAVLVHQRPFDSDDQTKPDSWTSGVLDARPAGELRGLEASNASSGKGGTKAPGKRQNKGGGAPPGMGT
jgi:hypothetical protein